MPLLVIGFLFVLFDETITFGNCIIDLLPDFAGYILLAIGLGRLKPERAFSFLQPFAVGMGVFSAALYALDLFGSISALYKLSFALALVNSVLSMVFVFGIIRGFIRVETREGIDLKTRSLKTIWMFMTIFMAGIYLSFFFSGTMAVLCNIVYSVAAIVFLVRFYKTSSLYRFFSACGQPKHTA